MLGGLDEGDEGAARFHGVDLVGAHCGVVLGHPQLQDDVGLEGLAGRDDLGTGCGVLVVVDTGMDTCSILNQHLKSSLHETIDAFRSESDSLLLGIDLFGDTDFQAFNVLTEHEATSEETTTPA